MGIARPRVLGQIFDHSGAKRIRFDVPQDCHGVGIVLNDRAFEPPLPDVSGRAVRLVIMPGMGDRQRLHDPADRLAVARREQQVEMIGHQAVAEEPERVTLLRLKECVQKLTAIIGRRQDGVAVIAPIQGMIDEAVSDGSGRSRHDAILKVTGSSGKKK